MPLLKEKDLSEQNNFKNVLEETFLHTYRPSEAGVNKVVDEMSSGITKPAKSIIN